MAFQNNDASQQTTMPVERTFTPSPILRKKIQAFQTITTFLGQIQRPAPIFLKDQHATQEHLNEVQLCDAFAHLAVIHHDVIAFATKRNDAQLETVACTSAEDDTPPDDSPKPPSRTFLKNCLSFFLCEEYSLS